MSQLEFLAALVFEWAHTPPQVCIVLQPARPSGCRKACRTRVGREIHNKKMKKQLRMLAFALGMLALMGCDVSGNEVLTDIRDHVQVPVLREPMEWKVVDGRLVFLDENHLNQGLGILSEMSPDSLVSFENSLSFRSLKSIDYLVNAAEMRQMEQVYQGLPDSMDADYYDSLGIQYSPSALCQQYLALGVINEEIDTFGGRTIYLAIDEPFLFPILNESGEVEVGGEIVKFEPRGRQSMSGKAVVSGDGKMLDVPSNNSWRINIHAHDGGWEVPSGGRFWVYDPCKDQNRRVEKKRYRYAASVTYLCSTSKKSMYPQLVMQMEARYLKYGNTWSKHPDYKPFWGTSAAWKYRNSFRTSPSATPFTVESTAQMLPSGSNAPKSPYYYSGASLYEFTKMLHPTGLYAIQSGSTWEFASDCQIHSASFIFKFSGCGQGQEFIAY